MRGYGPITASGLLAAIVFGRPEAIAIVAPFALALLAGLVPWPAADPMVAITPAFVRMIEGSTAVLQVEVHARAAELELELATPSWIGAARVPLRETGPDRWTAELVLAPRRWGAWRAESAVVRRGGLLSLTRVEQRVAVAVEVRVYPRPARLRRLVAPRRAGGGIGSWAARTQRGDGVEFAEIRPWVAGDPARRINSRASARRGQLWVTDRHPERNAEVVLLLDTFAEVRDTAGGTLDDVVRAASLLAAHHLDARDRVGVVGFGGVLHWLLPAGGAAHAIRIADSLLTSEISFSYVWRDVDIVPPRVLAPQALIIALSPLLDERSSTALLQLRGRRRDLVVIDVSPVRAVAARGTLDPLALRLWTAQRAAFRARLERAGVAVTSWNGGTLDPALEEVETWRRRAGRQVIG
ncbi:MAG: DUF58 domain-containing protein [Solirubrobacteraceae bacterium]